jgi:hypothetical protein
MANDPIDVLVRRADSLRDGPVKLALLEEATRLADCRHDISRGFELRRQMMWPALLSGRPEKMLAAFTWCIGQCDRNNVPLDEASLVREAVGQVLVMLRRFPQFSRRQIEEAFSNLEGRLDRFGLDRRPLVVQRCLSAAYLGDFDCAAKYWNEWQRLPEARDPDARSFDLRNQVGYFVDCQDVRRQIERFDLVRARLPDDINLRRNTFGSMLLPFIRCGRLADALDCHLRGYPLAAEDILYLDIVGEHIEFLALTDNLDRALALFERHLPWWPRTHEVLDRFWFGLCSRCLFHRLRDTGRKRIRFRVPKEMPFRRPGGWYAPSQVAAWLDNEARRIAAAFDARAGNDSFTRRFLGSREDLHRWVTPTPLPSVIEGRRRMPRSRG